MNTSVPCPACGKLLPIPATAIGKRLTCPACGERARVVQDGAGIGLEVLDEAASPDEAPKKARPVKARPVREAGEMAGADPKPSTARRRRTGSGRVTHRTRGGIDHDAEPAGRPVPTVMGAIALNTLCALLLAWAVWHLLSTVDEDKEWMMYGTGLKATESGIAYSPLTVGYLVLGILAYGSAAIGFVQGRGWARPLTTGIALVVLGLMALILRGQPWHWPIPMQLFLGSQILLPVLAWVPPTRHWMAAKANDRARDLVASRRGRRES